MNVDAVVAAGVTTGGLTAAAAMAAEQQRERFIADGATRGARHRLIVAAAGIFGCV